MILFVSDIHLGRSDAVTERLVERDLVALLRSSADTLEHLVLAGDVFDAYIEHRYLMPKGYTRLLGELAELSDRGIQITYLAGNHDPWHEHFFETEYGAQVVMDGVLLRLDGVDTWLHHGDGIDPASWKYRLLRPVLRHPLPVWFYKKLPADFGYTLARAYNRFFGQHKLDPRTAKALRDFAEAKLSSEGVQLVVMGHGHRAELTSFSTGTYVNCGYWHDDRTYATLDGGTVSLHRWNDGASVLVEARTVSAPERSVTAMMDP